MSEAHGARKTGKTDLYRTPYKAIIPLRMALSGMRNKTILDPCEGDGRIRKELSLIDPSNKVIGIEKYPDEPYINTLYQSPFDLQEIGLYKDLSVRIQSRDFLSYNKPVDIVAGNPPFSLKKEFISHGLEIAEYTCMLLAMHALSYNEIQEDFTDIPEFLGKIVMRPKLMYSESGEWKPGGTTAYAWLFWKKGNRTRGSWEHYIDLRRL